MEKCHDPEDAELVIGAGFMGAAVCGVELREVPCVVAEPGVPAAALGIEAAEERPETTRQKRLAVGHEIPGEATELCCDLMVMEHGAGPRAMAGAGLASGAIAAEQSYDTQQCYDSEERYD